METHTISIEQAAFATFTAAGVKDAERLARFASEEAAAARDASAPPAGLPENETALLGAALAVRRAGELPHYLCKALAASLWGRQEEEQALRAYVRERYDLQYQPETVQLIAEQLEKLRTNAFMEDPCRVGVIKAAYRQGYHYEKTCRGCAQCTIAALFDVSGKTNPELFRAANGFAAGMGLNGDGVCGGYAGGVLFMGTYAGRRIEYFDNDREEKNTSMRLTQKLHDRYMQTYGSVICRDIHKDIFGRAFCIRNADEKEDFEKAGAHTADKCTAVVATASAWTTEILLEEGFLTC